MNRFEFSYNAQSKCLTVLVSDTRTEEVIEVVEYWHRSGSNYDYSQHKKLDVSTWREHEIPITRLESLAAAARLAFVQTLTEREMLTYAHNMNIEQDDVLWLFDETDKVYSIDSNSLTELDPWIDFHSDPSIQTYTH